ncbi:protein of unknown function Spy-related protein [Stanieria cyanosphaera PCC 7437]|uniref:Periplasmic heavy metal sensor n=1 Tax=Stanieria cyanosphaera (strain ATCC 29371 / PCC 7437) TaxID=111780 RepID=K9XR40_STAC7|nr:Spy/CpxP family protein refolding chaperone [Stanieria cyanosphaera]AFZ34122.1 protein of unknown function Spy-related protein [Stanieria cyanosphaera PCC 7437]
MKWRTLSTVAALSLILPVSAYAAQFHPQQTKSTSIVSQSIAQTPPDDNFRSEKKGPMRLFEQLNLTPEQSEQIETIKQNSQADHETLREELRQAKDQMRSLLASSDTSVEQLRQQQQQVQNLEQQLKNQKFETMLQMREVLTPEQLTQMADLIEQHHQRRGMRDR